jgi:hypothetical protein
MQVAPAYNYQQKIQEIQKELTQAFKQLREYKKSNHRGLKPLHKRIRKLYLDLTNLKFRASY